MDTARCPLGMSMLSVSVHCPVPIFPFRLLPTEDRPRVVLHGDQRLHWTYTRIDSVVTAPVLYDAVRMGLLMIFVLLEVSVLGGGSQGKKAKQAKRAYCKTEGGKLFSHDESPVFSVRNSAHGHPTPANI